MGAEKGLFDIQVQMYLFLRNRKRQSRTANSQRLTAKS